MLLSILFSLVSTGRTPILGPLGRPGQAWFLGQVTRQNPVLGDALHSLNGLRPYTVSTLLDHRGRPLRPGCWLEPGQEVWLRVTTFSEQLSALTVEKILRRLPGHLELYKMVFRLDGFTLDPAQHPWAGQSSFAALSQDSQLNWSWEKSGSSKVRLEFATPTAFRAGQVDVPMPDPGRILKSLWSKWNSVTPEPLQVQEIWPDFAANCVVLSELAGVNTERWEFAEGSRGMATGFTGAVGLTLLAKNQCGEWAQYWDGAAAVLQLLAAFAFYSGAGHHTSVGMGQARPIALGSQRRG